jgi:hypothetical protein
VSNSGARLRRNSPPQPERRQAGRKKMRLSAQRLIGLPGSENLHSGQQLGGRSIPPRRDTPPERRTRKLAAAAAPCHPTHRRSLCSTLSLEQTQDLEADQAMGLADCPRDHCWSSRFCSGRVDRATGQRHPRFSREDAEAPLIGDGSGSGTTSEKRGPPTLSV